MGKLSLKTSLTIFLLDYTSKSGFRISSKIFESALNVRIGLPNAQQTQILFLVKTIKCKT
jgi:hypothetical protein